MTRAKVLSIVPIYIAFSKITENLLLNIATLQEDDASYLINSGQRFNLQQKDVIQSVVLCFTIQFLASINIKLPNCNMIPALTLPNELSFI